MEVASKACRECGAEKPLSSYSKDSRRKDGLSSFCRACTSIKRRKAATKYNNSDKGRAAVRRYHLSEKGKKARREAQDRHQSRWPQKIAARQKAAIAIRVGEIVPDASCSVCGEVGQTQAHHDDYSKPLEVRWLCTMCHANYHKLNKAILAI